VATGGFVAARAQQAPATGVISGVVVDGSSGAPVPGAIVFIAAVPDKPIGPERRQITDERGRFAFVNLPADTNYTIASSKFGYLDGGYGRDVLPTDPLVYVLAGISTVMAAFIQFFITYSLAMFAFWILEISTIVFIVYSFEYFLGGQMFPIDIMPAAVQAVMKWLPFYYELFCPVAIFLGRLKGPDLVQALAIQTAWLLLAWAWANFMWKRGLGHYQAVGG